MRRAVARIDLGAVAHNAAVLARASAPAQLCAVVKADGYGHGAVACARAAQRGGARCLAVATAAEAAELRAGGIEGPVLVLGALTGGELELALAARADVAVWDERFTARVAALAPGTGVHVKLDTGMGRLGARDAGRAAAVVRAAAAAGLRVAGLMTHFATADEDDPAFLEQQLARFRAWAEPLRAHCPGALLHAANSAAALRAPHARLDLVRCGIALYGLDPFGEDPAAWGLEPALSLRSYVARLERFEPGETAGYGRRWAAARPTWVATVPVGYGDGVRRALTNDLDVLVGGRRHPLIGTVSMDNITVAVGEGERPEAALGDEVVLLGAQGSERVLAEDWARRLATINYEVTCGISARVPREHAGP